MNCLREALQRYRVDLLAWCVMPNHWHLVLRPRGQNQLQEFMRWLTVSVPGHPERQIMLEKPGRPRMSEETALQVRELLTKGAMGGSLIFSTDDCRKTYETLLSRGVELTEEPTERPYGTDCGLRDPFGNAIRFTQPKP